MIKQYRHRTHIFNGFPANLHYYIGNCPLTGKGIVVQIKDMTEEQLKAWIELDANAAAKYVQVIEVPDIEEPTPKTKARKASKKIKNEQSETTSNAGTEAETPEKPGAIGEQPDNSQ